MIKEVHHELCGSSKTHCVSCLRRDISDLSLQSQLMRVFESGQKIADTHLPNHSLVAYYLWGGFQFLMG